MLLQSLANLTALVQSLILVLIHRVDGWKYPTVNYINHGHQFTCKQELVEIMIFNAIKYHPLMKVLKKLWWPCVIRVSVHNQQLRLNVYRLVKDRGETDMAVPTKHLHGTIGQFHYLSTRQGLFHAKTPTSVTRAMGFLETDPFMSFCLPLDDAQRLELDEIIRNELQRMRTLIHQDTTWERIYTPHPIND